MTTKLSATRNPAGSAEADHERAAQRATAPTAPQARMSGPSTGGGSDTLPWDMTYVVVSNLAMRACRGDSRFGVPSSRHNLVRNVACEMVGFFIIVQKTSYLYQLIAPTVEGLLRAGVLVERDGAIRVGQEDRSV